MSSIIRYQSTILRRYGLIARGQACCCDGGCCPTTLLETDILIAEVVSLSGPHTECWTVGDTTELHFAGGQLWQSIDCLSETSFGLEMACYNNTNLGVTWKTDGEGCVPAPTVPNAWYLISGQCDPFEFFFGNDLTPDASLGCNEGTIVIKITKKPP